MKQPQKRPRIKAYAITEPNATQEKFTEKAKKDSQVSWVQFFKASSNTYPNDIARRSRRSATHGAIVKSKITYAAGNELQFFDGEEPIENLPDNLDSWSQDVDGNRTTLHDVYRGFQDNFVKLGNAYIEVQIIDGRTFLFTHDATKVRIAKDKKTAYISAFWRQIGNGKETKDHPVKRIPMWDGNLETEQTRFLIHAKQDTQEYDYYGLPEHHGVFKWADLEYDIPTFNLERFKNGFMPSVLMTFKGTPTGTTPQEFVENVRDKFTGEGNSNKMFIQLVSSDDQAPDVTEFSTTKEGEFTELQELATNQIISGHRWFPELAGIAVSGKLSGAKELRNQYELAMNGLVIPEFQMPANKIFNDILTIAGFEGITTKPVNAAPVGLAELIDVNEVMDINEKRAALGLPELEEEIQEENGNNENELDDGSGSDNGSDTAQSD